MSKYGNWPGLKDSPTNGDLEMMKDHSCPYDQEYCAIGSMCVECCADNNVYRRY